jgi:hypothetical protein
MVCGLVKAKQQRLFGHWQAAINTAGLWLTVGETHSWL